MTTSITPFDVVLVPFPFVETNTTKKRPALILASFRPRAMRDHFVICMMTSQVESPHFPFDWEVQELGPTGLPKRTLIRPSKMVTIDSSLILKKLGRLGKRDSKGISDCLGQLFKDIL